MVCSFADVSSRCRNYCVLCGKNCVVIAWFNKGDIFLMDSPFMEAVKGLFEWSWKLLTTVKFPGTEITMGAILVGVFVIVVGLRIVGFVMNIVFSTGSASRLTDALTERSKKL